MTFWEAISFAVVLLPFLFVALCCCLFVCSIFSEEIRMSKHDPRP